MPRVDEKRVANARLKLNLALPSGHPVVQEVDDVLRLMWNELGEADMAMRTAQADSNDAIHVVETHHKLREVLADWRRGIRVWEEVEAELKAVGMAMEKQADPA